MTWIGRPAEFRLTVARVLVVWRPGEDGHLGVVLAELGTWVFNRIYELTSGRLLEVLGYSTGGSQAGCRWFEVVGQKRSSGYTMLAGEL